MTGIDGPAQSVCRCPSCRRCGDSPDGLLVDRELRPVAVTESTRQIGATGLLEAAELAIGSAEGLSCRQFHQAASGVIT